jgi:micrococcal nuclease
MRRVLAPRIAIIVLALIAAGVLSGAELVYGLFGGGPGSLAPPAPRTVVTVQRVTDGDTIRVSGTSQLTGRPAETIRLIGVDTPETVHPNRPVQCFGPEASAYTKRELPVGITVTLAFDAGTTEAQMRDRTPSRRLLAYVWRTDDRMHNLELVKGGYARASHYPPQDDYRHLFKATEATAKAANRGRWGACPT